MHRAYFTSHDNAINDKPKQSLLLQQPCQYSCHRVYATTTSIRKRRWSILAFSYYCYFCCLLPRVTTSYTAQQSMVRNVRWGNYYDSRHTVINYNNNHHQNHNNRLITCVAVGGGITEMQPLKTSNPTSTSSSSTNSTPRDMLLPLLMEEMERMVVGTKTNSAYRNSKKIVPSRPKNRPQSVPGATGKATALKQLLDLNSSSSRLSAGWKDGRTTSSTTPPVDFLSSNDNSYLSVSSDHRQQPSNGQPLVAQDDETKRKRGRPRKETGRSEEEQLGTAGASLDKRRKTLTMSSSKLKQKAAALVVSAKRERSSRAVPEYSTDKSITPTTDDDEELIVQQTYMMEEETITTASADYFSDGKAAATLKLNSKQPNNLSAKYYRAELLKSADEYSLGMKARFLMCCEEVHLGLSAELERLPTMVEWAEACHFGATFVDGTIDYELLEEAAIRPSGSASYFPTQEELEKEARMFIGAKGLGRKGPGRGKGRQRKKPRKLSLDVVKLKLDVEKIFPDILTLEARSSKNNTEDLPYFGTPQDFVDVMLAARSAKQQMVESNMRLVISIARRYQNIEGIGISDLVQEGSMGLMRAVEKFDPTKGFKFSTYASW
jgi:hypothetical protein